MVSGFVTALLQTKMGIDSLLAGIIVNTALYSVNIGIMNGASLLIRSSPKCVRCSKTHRLRGNISLSSSSSRLYSWRSFWGSSSAHASVSPFVRRAITRTWFAPRPSTRLKRPSSACAFPMRLRRFQAACSRSRRSLSASISAPAWLRLRWHRSSSAARSSAFSSAAASSPRGTPITQSAMS